MMEFLFCLLNYMKFYLILYLDGLYEICMNWGIKIIFYFNIGVCMRYKWKLIDKIFLEIEFCCLDVLIINE